MRVLYLCSDFGIDPGGTKGASIHVRAITRALTETGHEVRLLSPHPIPSDHPARGIAEDGVASAAKDARRWKRRLCQLGVEEPLAKELRSACFNGVLPDAVTEAVRDWSPEVVLERLSLFGEAGGILADRLGVPHVLEVNAPLVQEARRFRGHRLIEAAEQIERAVLRRASAVTVVSRELSEWAVRAGAVAERVHVIPNGADPAAYAGVDRQAAREELGLAGFVVGFVGSLKQWHGVDVLLEAFARLRAEHDDARLLVVGTGPEEEVLKKQATALGLNGTVRFTGAVPHEQVPTLVRAMDLAVAPFRRQEHFYFSPIKLFEYMMGGVCIAASNLGQIAEVLDDGRTGVLVEPDDPVALGGVLKRLYRDAEARAALGRNARAVALARHTWQQTAETLGRVLEACRRGGERAAKADSVSAAGGGC